MKLGILLVCLFSTTAILAKTQALNQLVYEIRDPKTDAAHFRQAVEKIGEYLALDVLEELNKQEISVETLTGAKASHFLVNEVPVLITILRAGLPLNYGVHRVFPNAEVGFFAMSRNEETLQPLVEYVSLPDLKDRTVILSDTMLATGNSLVGALKILEPFEPKQIYILAAIASQPGIDRIHSYNPNIKIIAAAIDPELNENGYICPGLGDAGDRSFGEKRCKCLIR